MELSERLLKCVGQSVNSEDFKLIRNELGNDLQFNNDKYRTIYKIPAQGIVILYEKYLDCILNVSFAKNTAAVREGSFKPFSGILPYGILLSDSRQTVTTKIGVPPFYSTPADYIHPNKSCSSCGPSIAMWQDKFHLPPLEIYASYLTPETDLSHFFICMDMMILLEERGLLEQWRR